MIVGRVESHTVDNSEMQRLHQKQQLSVFQKCPLNFLQFMLLNVDNFCRRVCFSGFLLPQLYPWKSKTIERTVPNNSQK